MDLSIGKVLKFGKSEVGIQLSALPKDFPVWSCECGSPFFYIAQNGPMCARCCKMQDIPKPR